MKIKFKILEVHPDEHSVTVRYYTDILTEDSLASLHNSDGSIVRRSDGSPMRCRTDYHINIWETNPTASIEKILEMLGKYAPVNWFKLKHDILNQSIDTSMTEVSNLINVEQEIEV